MTIKYIDYIICINYSEHNIYEYLLEKYKNKLTDKINKENFLKVKFKHIDLSEKEHPDLYITKNKAIINIIKELEKDNIPILNGFIFLKIRKDVAEYIDEYIIFNFERLNNINYKNNTIIFKCSVNNFIKYFKDVILLKYMLEEYMNYDFVCATIDLDEYYKSIFECGLNITKDEWINDMTNIIIYEGDENN